MFRLTWQVFQPSLRAKRSNPMRSIVPSKVEGSLDTLGMIRDRGSDCVVVKLLAMTEYWNKSSTTAITQALQEGIQ